MPALDYSALQIGGAGARDNQAQKSLEISDAVPRNSFLQAISELQLNPQEQSFYQRHLKNLYGSGGVDNPDGSRSSLYQTSVELDGKIYNLPTVWDGKILSLDEAIERARVEGLENFPSYSSEEEAEARYQKMHSYMERDTQQFLDHRNRTKAMEKQKQNRSDLRRLLQTLLPGP